MKPTVAMSVVLFCQVCQEPVAGDGQQHLRANEIDPDHAEALSRTSWQSLIVSRGTPAEGK